MRFAALPSQRQQAAADAGAGEPSLSAAETVASASAQDLAVPAPGVLFTSAARELAREMQGVYELLRAGKWPVQDPHGAYALIQRLRSDLSVLRFTLASDLTERTTPGQ